MGSEAAVPATSAAVEAGGELVVAWSGLDAGTLDALAGEPGLELCSFPAGSGSAAGTIRGADVLHLARSDLRRLPGLRRALPDTALVLDLRGSTSRLAWLDARRAEAADAIVVETQGEVEELRRRRPSLAGRVAAVPRPVDVDAFAPLDRLRVRRDAEIKRFRRLHRIAGPLVLYAGPYTSQGGLDLLLDAVERLRERRPELVLGAIPEGPVDSRHLDRCEGRALALGHRAVLEWAPAPADRPLWYALATVVCLPSRGRPPAGPARLAAAAGRPFVGSDLQPLREIVEEGETGFLVPSGEGGALVSILDRLIADEEAASGLGERARARAEAAWSPAAVAAKLRAVWLQAAAGRGAR